MSYGKRSLRFFSDVYCGVLVTVVVTATLCAIPFPHVVLIMIPLFQCDGIRWTYANKYVFGILTHLFKKIPYDDTSQLRRDDTTEGTLMFF